MVKKKQQIFLIYDGHIHELLMITTSVTKLKQFIKNKIKKGEMYYSSEQLSVNKQINLFNYDFKHETRNKINYNLINGYVTYVYDGEEM